MLIYLKGWRLTPAMQAKIESDKGGTLAFSKIQRLAIEREQVSHVQDAHPGLVLQGDTKEKTLTEIYMSNGSAIVVQGDMEDVCEQLSDCAAEKTPAAKPKTHAKKDTYSKLSGGTESVKREY